MLSLSRPSYYKVTKRDVEIITKIQKLEEKTQKKTEKLNAEFNHAGIKRTFSYTTEPKPDDTTKWTVSAC
jgi:hypothetical protein